jgi:precorrin-2 dehydrogenase/sirohydrochlorin ferrochelatase
MLPLALDVHAQKAIVVARGRPGQQRYELLHAAGCERIVLYNDLAEHWACEAEALLYQRLPEPEELAGARVVFIAGLPLEIAEPLAGASRAAGALVNVEDVLPLCDFHVPAIVRRGDLLISVSTGGRAPGLAQRLRAHLAQMFGVEWETRVRRLGDARLQWREEGASKEEVIRRSADMIAREAWLPSPDTP